MTAKTTKQWVRMILCGFGLAASLSATGCQMSIGGQTLPSPYYLKDDVQYYASGTEFKLPREAAHQKAYRAELQLQQANQ